MITGFALQNLPDSDQRLEAIFQAFNDLLFILDSDGTILDYRAGNISYLYLPPEKFLRQKMQDVLPPEVGRKVSAVLSQLSVGSPISSIEYFLNTPSGDGWYESRFVSLPRGQTMMLVRDITKFKESELKIKRQFDQLAALRSIDLAITSDLDLAPTLSLILAQVRTQLNIDAASILLFDPHIQMLQFVAGAGFKTRALQHTRLGVGEEYAGKAFLERKVFYIPNLKSRQTGFLRSPFLAKENFIAYYAVPLISKGQAIAVLEIFHRGLLDADEEWMNFMNILAGQAAIAIDNAILFKNLQSANNELTSAYDQTIEGWSRALDLRDKETEGHSRRVTQLTYELGSRMGISQPELGHICRGALLHDIGKVAIPDHILLKPGPLNEEEWVTMRRHPLIAVELLASIEHLLPALDIPRSHHEKWNGTGYPNQIAGEEIPLAARLFALVDVYDALTSDRPYRRAWSREDALEYIHNESGAHFDPSIVPVFVSMISG